MNRREMLRSMALAAGAAGAGIAWRAAETGAFGESQGAAYRPWREESESSGLYRAVRAAILAASPHNTQPWRFRLADCRIDLLADASRTIGAIDPLLREQHIGTGCALENLVVAAEGAGYTLDELDYDDSGTDHIASVQFVPRAARESMLCRAIPHRHTNRGPYRTDRTASASILDAMDGLNTDPDEIRVRFWTESPQQIRELTIAAAEAVVADRQQNRDSARWFRPNAQAIALHRDGTTVEAQGLSPLMTALAKLLPPASDSLADRVFLKNTREVYCGPGATFGTILVKAPQSKSVRVRVGRLWQRMHLWATAHGIAMQPVSQIHERIDREATSAVSTTFTRDLRNLTGERDWQGIFTFRMGFAERPALPSPRRELAACLI
jgi:hypothetical protein